jgi:hypothetical protein
MYNDNIWRFLSMKSMINDLFINFEVLVLHHQMYLYEDKTGNDVNETLYNVSKSLHLLIGLLYMRINSNLTVVFVMLSLY